MRALLEFEKQRVLALTNQLAAQQAELKAAESRIKEASLALEIEKMARINADEALNSLKLKDQNSSNTNNNNPTSSASVVQQLSHTV